MQKLELEKNGDLFVKSMKTCLSWLALGGTVKLKSGHVLAMDAKARPGFLATNYDTKTGETKDMIFHLDSETSWSFLVDYARRMTEEDLTAMAMNLALNESTKS